MNKSLDSEFLSGLSNLTLRARLVQDGSTIKYSELNLTEAK